MRKRYVLVGAGARGIDMYARSLAGEFASRCELAGLCDPNPGRVDRVRRELSMPDLPASGDFMDLLDEVRPDSVVVASPDHTHHDYIIESLKRNLDVVTEKPMTIDDAKCRAILDAEAGSRGSLCVGFNYRYASFPTGMKQLIAGGHIGEPVSVDLQWYLDVEHGADYFRRWHRRREHSGGLLVHKATHHFDLVNWLLGSEPEEVFARAARHMYGPTREARGERCLTCPHKETCEFRLDIENRPRLANLYLAHESHDGYFRDRCVFDPEIDICDTFSLSVKYRSGAFLTYSLNAFMPYEGESLAVHGLDGRVEYVSIGGTVFKGRRHPAADGKIRLYPLFKEPEAFDPPRAVGGHGGGDARLLRDLFGDPADDPLGHRAGSRAGAMSLLIGVAAYRSMDEHRPVRIDELLGEHAAP